MTCPTGKKRYRTKKEAHAHLQKIKARNKLAREEGRPEDVFAVRRAYHCKICKGGHLTSQVQRTGRPRPKTARRVKVTKGAAR